jgi:hypothetical protein
VIDRAAHLRTALMAVSSALDQAPAAYLQVRAQIEPLVDAVFSGQDISSTLLKTSVTVALKAYWSAGTSQFSDQMLLERLAKLYSLALEDPAHIASIDAEFPREIPARPLRASAAPPLSYVLDSGAVVLSKDPDPIPERETPDIDELESEPETQDPESEDPGSEAPEANLAQADYTAALQTPSSSTPESVAALLPAGWAIDDVAGEPLLLYRYYRDLAVSAFDQLSLIARHRVQRRLSESLDEEEWIVQLSDAVANVGREALTAARRHFIQQIDADPNDLWGSVFFLGCAEGLEAARLLDELLGMLDDTSDAAAATVADAVSKGTSPELTLLLRDWAVSPAAAKRAVALAVQCRRQQIGAEAAERGLSDTSRVVRLLMLQGLRDLDAGSPDLGEALLPMLRSLWSMADAEIAWQAVLTACWFGLGEAYRVWRSGELTTLGAYELDLITLVGDAKDLPRVRTIVESSDLGARRLRLLARYGHPAVIPVLIHGLKDEELQNDAADALEVLLGPRLDSDARLDPTAWTRAVVSLSLRPDRRLWLGEPYLPSRFMREVDRGRCSLIELTQYLEEIRSRTCCRIPTGLYGWHAANQGRIEQLRGELHRADGQYSAGDWTSALTWAK